MKKYYLFDAVTGESSGSYLAQKSPLEAGVYIAPINSTPVAPPVFVANKVAVFSSGAWSMQPDFRGQTWFDAQGNAVEISAIGTPGSTLTSVLPAAILLFNAKIDQIATFSAAYNTAIQLPVAYMATTFQADTGSQGMLTKCLVAGSVPAGFYWLDASNAQVTMTFAQLQGLAGAMLVQGQAAFAHLQTQKSAVKAATTIAEVQAVR